MPSDRIYRYVPHHEVTVYEAMGWIKLTALTDSHHDQWAVLMEYLGPDREHPMGPPDDR